MVAPGRRIWEANAEDFDLGLSKRAKLEAGLYIILRDYADGRFPPTFADQAAAYQAEIDYTSSLPGVEASDALRSRLRKPFWGSKYFSEYSTHFARLASIFEERGITTPARLMELGCGSGWMAEFFATLGYRVLGTSIAPVDVELGERRVAAAAEKGIEGSLEFLATPMESADEAITGREPFDGVYVFEAIHHAFDWRRTVHSAYRCLRPGGWFVLANEPNVAHSAVSYRVARLTNTHEIGISQKQLIGELRTAGFTRVDVIAPRFNNRVSDHWIAAQR